MNTQTAHEFLTRCFQPGETIALLLRKESPASTTQRIVTLEQATASRYLAWLRYENHNGANVYAAANPLRAGSRKRTKDCVAEVRHLYLDIDMDGDNRVAALMESEAVPVPTVILSTSPDKYQVLWKVEGFDFDKQESTLKLLAIAFGGDSACTDRNRVLRVPGFLNRKYDPSHVVTVEYPSDSTYRPADFRLDNALLESALTPYGLARMYPTGKNTHSEQDWAWVVQQISHGEDAGNQPYMALVIEATDESGPCGLPAISVCHYGEQNGDLIRDPEMCFEFGLAGGAHLTPFYWRNDYAGVEQWSRFIRDGNYIFHTALYNQHEQFAEQWDKNLRSQGFAEAFEQQQTPRA